ncbi:MAG TPA: hypothetical protein VMA86_06725 [Acetobacteraceae bacterium]|nr:hypothetical protein [Acetobacteraceae bacterium]
MSISEEDLLAFVDGELEAGKAARIEAMLAGDPALRAEVERQRALALSLRGAFAPTLNEDNPEHLLRAIRAAPVSRRYRAGEFARTLRTRRVIAASILPAGIALACGLLLGIAIGHRALDSALVVPGAGGLVARGALAHALEHQLASEQGGAETVGIGVSYRDRDGRFCRSFTAGGEAGVACRDPDAWHVAALAAARPQSSGPYAQAGSTMPAAIRAAIQATIAGPAFGPAAERSARAQGWRAR